MSLFTDNSISELSQNILDGKASCVEYASEVISKYNENESKIKAWISFEPETLMKEANDIDRNVANGYFNDFNKLTGIPFGVKDIFNTKEYTTEMGSQIWKGFRAGNNARVVDSLVDHGAIVAGKTVTAEFAVHHLNDTVNPYDPTKTPGTSSSGSAAAVAVGAVPFALATQTAGSIVRPASFCGIWGYKPSFGLIPRTGVLKTTDSLDTIGFLSSNFFNFKTLLDITRVKGPDYPFVFRKMDMVSNEYNGGKVKIGFIKTYVWDNAQKYVKDSLINLISKLSKQDNIEVIDIEPTNDIFYEAHQIHETIYNKSLSYYFKNEIKQSDFVSPIMSEMIKMGADISIEEFQKSLTKQEKLIEYVDTIFNDVDLLVSIGTSSSAPLREETELQDPSLIWTLSHIPSISIPAFTDPDGMPFSFQIVSRKYNDYFLLSVISNLIKENLLPSKWEGAL